jgi:ATP-dependent Zn protease
MHRRAVAFHEAGHAVVAYRLGVEVEYVTIVPDHFARAHVALGDLFWAHGRGSDRANLERAIKIDLAGPLAEVRALGRRRGGRTDYERASGLARYLAGAAGEREFLRHMERRIRALIECYWSEIERVAAALLERDELRGAEVKDVIEAPRRLEAEDRADKWRWLEAMAADEPQEP